MKSEVNGDKEHDNINILNERILLMHIIIRIV